MLDATQNIISAGGQVKMWGFKSIAQVGLVTPKNQAESHGEPPPPTTPPHTPLGAGPLEEPGNLRLPTGRQMPGGRKARLSEQT